MHSHFYLLSGLTAMMDSLRHYSLCGGILSFKYKYLQIRKRIKPVIEDLLIITLANTPQDTRSVDCVCHNQMRNAFVPRCIDRLDRLESCR